MSDDESKNESRRFGPIRSGHAPSLIAFDAESKQEWSVEEVNSRSAKIAAALRKRGHERGDRFGLFCPPSAGWVFAALGALRMGGVIVPIDDKMPDESLTSALGDGGISLLFTDGKGADRLQHLEEDVPEVLRTDTDEDEDRLEAWLEDEEASPVDWNPDEIAVVFFTSGTTGPPKSVPLTWKNLAFQWETIERSELVQEGDRLLLPLPLHHVYPLVIGLFVSFRLGVTVILPHALTGKHLSRALDEGEATVLLGVPRLLESLVNGIRSRLTGDGALREALFRGLAGSCYRMERTTGWNPGIPLFRPLRKRVGKRLRLLVSGGSPLAPDLARTIDGMGWRLAVGYGLTETSPLLTLLHPNEKRYETVGRPVDGVEFRVEKGEEGEPEIRAKGPGIFSGYENRPEETEASFDGEWFNTGDVGGLDEEGFLTIRGRSSTLLVLESGENIPLETLEDVYEDVEAVREIGLLLDEGKLTALAVPEGDADRDTLAGQLREKGETQPSTRQIQNVRLTSRALPRTRLGKIRRNKLEERYEEAGKKESSDGGQKPVRIEDMSSEDRALLDNEQVRKTWKILTNRYGDRPLTLDSNLENEAGVDSLEWVELTLRIEEKTGVTLESDHIAELESIRDLLRSVAEPPGDSGDSGVDPLEEPKDVLSEDELRWIHPRSRLQRIAGTVPFYLCRWGMRLLFRIRIEGMENLPDSGPYLLCPNHSSYLDVPALMARLPFPALRTFYWAGLTQRLFRNAFLRGMSRIGQVFPVDPARGPRESLAYAAALLQRGCPVVWFPEGTRSGDGSLQDFQPGIGLLAGELDVPLISVFIEGTHRALPPGRAIPRPGPIRIKIGEVKTPDQLKQSGEGESDVEAITDALRREIQQMGTFSHARSED